MISAAIRILAGEPPKAHAHPGVGLKNASRSWGVERERPENDQCEEHSCI